MGMSIDYVVPGKQKDLGGFQVHRLLPTAQKRQVGPFVFLDHMGPLQVNDQLKLNVRPHPHIGLATVTYLFEGQAFHRDSLGSQQLLKPGAINLMVAGRGIAHSERTPHEVVVDIKRQHGVQIWLGLPREFEDSEPAFYHHGSEELPELDVGESTRLRVLMGEILGVHSPVKTFSKTLFLDFQSQKQDSFQINFECAEVAIYLIEGELTINAQSAELHHLYIARHGETVKFGSAPGTRFIVLGGTPFPEKRHMWWNFVSSDPSKIREAAEKWKAQAFPPVPGDNEFIPLPDDSYLKL